MKQHTKGIRCILALALLGYGITATAGLFGNSCGKMEDWMKVIDDWRPDKDMNKIYTDEVREYLKPAFHDDVMNRIWGSPYAEMSTRERTSIQKTINSCTKESWAKVGLAVPFSNPPDRIKQAPHSDYGRWQTAITQVNSMSYAELQDLREQRIAAEHHAAKQRKSAIAAAQARQEHLKQLKEQRRREAMLREQQEQAAAQDRMALVEQHADSGPFRSTGASYLNALYLNDINALTAYDKMYADSYTQMMGLYKGSGLDALVQLFGGQVSSNKLEQVLHDGFANLSMVTSVAGAYVLYYEHAYPDCMDRNPLVYTRTREYEWVKRNNMGTVLSHSPGWTDTDKFKINRRFKYVWDHMGAIEKADIALYDMFLGKSGAIRLIDAMNSTTGAMQRHACDSAEMRQLETNMLAYFRSAMERLNKVLQ